MSSQLSFGKFVAEYLNNSNTRLRLYFEFPLGPDNRTVHNAVQRLPHVDPHTIQVKQHPGHIEVSFALMIRGMTKHQVDNLSRDTRSATLIGLYQLHQRVAALEEASEANAAGTDTTDPQGRTRSSDRRNRQRKPQAARTRR